jgi:RNA polymerase sigma-70 factor, ECF subfamily
MNAAVRATHSSERVVPKLTIEDQVDLMDRMARHGDREAFSELFMHFGPRLKAMMIRSGADSEAAEDLVQDVMMTVWRKVHLYVPERGAVSTWIYRIARNARIDRLRRGTSQSYVDLDNLELADDADNGEDMTYAAQRDKHVADALADLPGEQRSIIEYAYIQDMSQSEIASKLELPLGTVKSRMRLAYGKLKGKLEGLQ